MTALTTPLAAIGRPVLAALAAIGRVVIFAAQGPTLCAHTLLPARIRARADADRLVLSARRGPDRRVHRRALALQIYSGARFNAESSSPPSSPSAWWRELGPVLGGLMVAARVASSIAAEIGTMKVTEQIDALTTLSTNPIKYLAVPRVLAATLAVPVLVGVGDAIGIAGGWLVGVNRLGFNSTTYLQNTYDFLESWDVVSGLWKGAAFGFIVALMGCYHGMNSGRGAQGVGAATKGAVVSASVLILATNYILTELFFTA